jgi:hypothetical protein
MFDRLVSSHPNTISEEEEARFFTILAYFVLGEGKTTYTFSISVNAFSVEFLLACYQQAGRVWYISGALWRTYTLFYPAPFVFPSAMNKKKFSKKIVPARPRR